MILISGCSNIPLAKTLSKRMGARLVIANTQKFADQELKIRVEEDLKAQDVFILQSTSRPANDHLMELLLLADTAKRAGCRTLTAIMPYFGYSRQDRASYDHGPVSASLVARLIEESSIERLITVDLHSKQSEGFFKIPVHNFDMTGLFAAKFIGTPNLVIVSPDVGGLPRAKALSTKLSAELVMINKIRDTDGKCEMSEIIGNVQNKNCLIVDDIVDTGGTICKAAQLLKEYGASSVSACITHAVLSYNCLERICEANFTKFYTTDSIYHKSLPDFIQVISLAEVLYPE